MNIFNTYLPSTRIELNFSFLTTNGFCVIVLSEILGVGGDQAYTLICYIGLSDAIAVGITLITVLFSLAPICFISAINNCVELSAVLILISTVLPLIFIMKVKEV